MKHFSFHRHNSENEQGSAILSTLIAVGVSVILMSFIVTNQSNRSAAQLVADQASDVYVMQKYIGDGLDCPATITALGSNCTPGNPIALSALSLDNPILILKAKPKAKPPVYQHLGNYELKASCEDCAKGEKCAHGHKLVVYYRINSQSWTDLYRPDRLKGCQVPF